MQQLTCQPPADFTSVNQAAFTDLSVRQASFTAGTMHTNNSTASAPVTERLTLAGLGTVTLKSALHLVQVQGTWLVSWSPATIAPRLRTGDQLSLQTTWPARAAILGAGNTPVTSQGQVVTIGVEGARIKNAKASLRSALVAAGARRPQAGTRDRRGQDCTRRSSSRSSPCPRPATTSWSRPSTRSPGRCSSPAARAARITPGLAAGVVGTVGPVTAQQLSQLGAPYNATSVVGPDRAGAGRRAAAGRAAGRHGVGRHRAAARTSPLWRRCPHARAPRSPPRSTRRRSGPPRPRWPGRRRAPRWSR